LCSYFDLFDDYLAVTLITCISVEAAVT